MSVEPFRGFGPLADALMSSLASRSHQWRKWELHELRLEVRDAIGGYSRVERLSRCGLIVETARGERRELLLKPDASAAASVLRIFDERGAEEPASELLAQLSARLEREAIDPQSPPLSPVDDLDAVFAAELVRLRRQGLDELGLRLESWLAHSKDSRGRYAQGQGRRWLLLADEFELFRSHEAPSTGTLRLAVH